MTEEEIEARRQILIAALTPYQRFRRWWYWFKAPITFTALLAVAYAMVMWRLFA